MKLLVAGSVNGKYASFFKKIASLNKKHGPFDLLLIVGDFFANTDEFEPLRTGKIAVPIPTYVIAGEVAPPAFLFTNDGEICENLSFLGKSGVLKTFEGLRIAYLSGVFDAEKFNDGESKSNYSFTDIQTLQSQSAAQIKSEENAAIDVLLTCEWPESITSKSLLYTSKHVERPISGSGPIADLVQSIKPRYHFAAKEKLFFEREPFALDDGKITRFLGLADFENETKDRWFYAISITPSDPKVQRLENVTESPFWQGFDSKSKRVQEHHEGNFFFSNSGPQKRSKHQNGPPESYTCHKCGEKGHWKDDCRKSKVPDSYTCKICGVKGHWIQDCPSKDGTSPKSRDLSQCWFCLANPNLEKHLLIAIGDYNYLTLAKGGLTDFGHILIVPIEHFPSTKCLNEGPIMSHGELAQADWIHQVERTLKDMEDLKKKIAVVLKGMGYRCIVFEMYPGDLGLGKQVHAHLQIVPIPNEITDEIILDEIKNSCKGQGIYITNEDSGTKSAERPFCIFELVSFDLKSTERVTVGPTPEVFARYKEEKVVYDEMVASGRRAVKPLRLMNAQFGRIVLANVLNLPDRVDWKRCSLGEEEEKKQMVTLKKVFGNVFV